MPRYGLDIETDTSIDGLDPAVSAVVGVAIAGDGAPMVLDGPEHRLLAELDELLRDLPAGVLITWNGGGFDLPFLARRAARSGIELGLRLRHDPRIVAREPLVGCPGVYRAVWHRHRHLDGYRVYRADVGCTFGLSCGLKALARTVGLAPVEVDRAQIHRLPAAQLASYVASDAMLARSLIERRWATAVAAIDDPAFVSGEPDVVQSNGT